MRRFRPTRFPRYSTTDCALHGASLSLCARKEKVSKEKTHPTYGPAFRFAAFRVRSLHRHSRGSLRRADLGPSQLSRHPCRSTPYTPIPLTLLTGLPARAYLNVIRRVDNRTALSTKLRLVEKPQAAFSTLQMGSVVGPSPSGGRVQVLCRGAFGRDAK